MGKRMTWASKAHIAVDVESDMSLTAVMASANMNEKKHAPELLDKVAEVLDGFKIVVTDSQYSVVNQTLLS